MALQTVIDDSYGPLDRHPYYVLAGFVSPAERWESFSDEWEVELKRQSLPYFKMNEAVRSKNGPWKGVPEDERRRRIGAFVSIARKHASLRVRSVIKISEYQRHLKPHVPKELDGPYVPCFLQIITSVAAHHRDHNWKEPVDFIFDEQQQFSKELVSTWWHIRNISEPFNLSALGDQPTFRDDKTFLPLQAADLYAWLVRDHASMNKTLITPMRPELKALEAIRGLIHGEFANLDKMASVIFPEAPSARTTRRTKPSYDDEQL